MNPETNRRILIIDDNEAIHEDYKKILSDNAASEELEELESALFGGQAEDTEPRIKYEITSAQQGQEGVEFVQNSAEQERPYAMAFVDMRMPPGMDGLETVTRIWEVDPDIQIVICTAYSDYSSRDIIEAVGDTDQLLFLRKPFDNAEVAMMARTLTEKWNLARRARMRMAQLESIIEEHTAELRKEVIERRAAQDRLQHAAFHDTLTGLFNRAYLMDRLKQCIDRQAREDNYRFAVLFLDLDNFKLINDSLGHDVGDELLIEIAERLKRAVRAVDTVAHNIEDTTARLGGDEFIVLLDGISAVSDVVNIAERVQELLTKRFDLRGQETTVTASIGIAISDRKYDRPEDILRDADTAMYRAKESGKARHAIFDEGLHAEAIERLRMENELRRAIDEDSFHLVYQPIVSAEDCEITGFEALLRWDHPERGSVQPDDFIQIMEELGLIIDVGRWGIRQACSDLANWGNITKKARKLYVSINLSQRQVAEPGLYEYLVQTLQEFNLQPEQVRIEVTETSLVDNTERVSAVLQRLRDFGVGVMLDDFGTGLSSLSCLHTMPIDTLKIDRSFIMKMRDKQEFAAIVHAVLTLADHMNLQVVAEGVETPEQYKQLLELGCHYIQGYHVSKTLTTDQVVNVLRDGLGWQRAA